MKSVTPHKVITASNFLDEIAQKRIMIIGDVMVDSYLWGHVNRISPEAPVPIVDVVKREERLGGAGNVVLNIQAMGATPIICTVIGTDAKADTFLQLLKQSEISTQTVVKSPERCTTTKFRIIGNNAQMLRVDEEHKHELSAVEEQKLLGIITTTLQTQVVDAIIFQDYDKGVITKTLIKQVVKLANEKGIPTCVDPKKQHFMDYHDVTLIKPNLKELYEGLNLTFNTKNLDSIEKAMVLLQKTLAAKIVFTTLSELGVAIYDTPHFFHHPAHIRQIADVSGAGDTVISVASLCLALGLNTQAIARISNLAGGLVCESVGVVPVDKSRLLDEIISHHCL
ncbi:MAG: PfkB family carbohydrate kinase [Bacteroidales bacterium]|jgi:rfaE bifunctional protein kinase chain/domain|nr:PfkB family carbohydrate kinase [Bacteroidales bacterium]